MDSKVDLQPAYILHSRPYKDTSAIIDFFTQDHGRVSAVANGARRPKSPWRAALQPFRLILLSWKGKSDLKSVRDVDLGETPYPLSGKALLSGMYLNELTVRLTHRFVSHPFLFNAYQETLGNLSLDPVAISSSERSLGQLRQTHIEIQLRQFELALLEELGYGLSLECESNGVTAIIPEGTYRFDAHHGFEWVEGIIPVDWNRLCFSGQSLLSLSKRCYDNDKVLKDAKR